MLALAPVPMQPASQAQSAARPLKNTPYLATQLNGTISGTPGKRNILFHLA